MIEIKNLPRRAGLWLLLTLMAISGLWVSTSSGEDGSPSQATLDGGASAPGTPLQGRKAGGRRVLVRGIGCAPNLGGVCNDDNPCTDDSCDSTSRECVNTPNTAICDDGNPCTLEDRCSARECAGRALDPKASCNDGNSCTLDYCDPSFGCFHLRRVCNDFNRNTIDSCAPTVGCIHTRR